MTHIYKKQDLSKILFVDIETVGSVKKYGHLSEKGRRLWDERADFIRMRTSSMSHIPNKELFLLKSGIYPEFAKIICMSVAYFKNIGGNSVTVKVKSFKANQESQLINDFFSLISELFDHRGFKFICGHNIREFDLPFICRRALANAIPLPEVLNFAGLKPWQIKTLIDTMDLWKFGDFKNMASLDLLCYTFGIPSPKDSLDGKAVHLKYWFGNALEEITRYCEQDVCATAQLFCRLISLNTNAEFLTIKAV